jgi:ATP-dependent DNA helicase RecG
LNPHSYRLKGRDFVHQGKIEIDVNERAVFIRTQGCFFVYTNSDCFLNRLANMLFVTRKTISTHMKIMKKNNVIERIGSDRKGYWKIL